MLESNGWCGCVGGDFHHRTLLLLAQSHFVSMTSNRKRWMNKCGHLHSMLYDVVDVVYDCHVLMCYFIMEYPYKVTNAHKFPFLYGFCCCTFILHTWLSSSCFCIPLSRTHIYRSLFEFPLYNIVTLVYCVNTVSESNWHRSIVVVVVECEPSSLEIWKFGV